MRKDIQDFSTILNRQWLRVEGKPDKIYGFWEEDRNQYEITVPPQLRDMILELQNALCLKYNELQEHRQNAVKCERQLKDLFIRV